MTREIKDFEIKGRFDEIMKSLKVQQKEIWNKIDILNAGHMNNESESICAEFTYHNKLHSLMSQVNHLRSLELMLNKLFTSDDLEFDNFDEFVKDTAKVYCKPW